MCRSEREARDALSALRTILGELGLELKRAKTRIVHLCDGGEGLDFLGFDHRWVRATRAKRVQFLARWSSRQGMQHARDEIRDLTARRWLLRPVEETVGKRSTSSYAAGRATSATETQPATST